MDKKSDLNDIKVYGERFLTQQPPIHTETVEKWDWVPDQRADLKFLKESASIPGTTGTGPDASTDERPDEM